MWSNFGPYFKNHIISNTCTIASVSDHTSILPAGVIMPRVRAPKIKLFHTCTKMRRNVYGDMQTGYTRVGSFSSFLKMPYGGFSVSNSGSIGGKIAVEYQLLTKNGYFNILYRPGQHFSKVFKPYNTCIIMIHISRNMKIIPAPVYMSIKRDGTQLFCALVKMPQKMPQNLFSLVKMRNICLGNV